MRKIVIVMVFIIGIILSTTDIYSGQIPLNESDAIGAINQQIDVATKYWIEDVKKLTKIDVVITNKGQNAFKIKFIAEASGFIENKDRVIRLGKRGLTIETINKMQSQGVFKALNMKEMHFWFDLGLRKAILLTGETTRNIYYAMLLAQIGTKPVNSRTTRITLSVMKYLYLLDCQNPPYSKWYCH